MCVAVITQRIGVGKSLPMLRLASYAIDAVPFGHRILRVPPSSYVEGYLDRLVQFLDFAGIACPHQPLQAVARNGEYVVEIRNTGDGQSLSAAKNHFRWELTDRSGNERDHDRADVFENCITSEDHDRSAIDWRG